MARLHTRDVKEILDMLEDGINVMPKLDKIAKMKMRSKIGKQVSIPSTSLPLPRPEGGEISDKGEGVKNGISYTIKLIGFWS